MQGAVVMLLALSGLGCQNPKEAPPPPPPGAEAGIAPLPTPRPQAGIAPPSLPTNRTTAGETPPPPPGAQGAATSPAPDGGPADVAPPPAIPAAPPLGEGTPNSGPSGVGETSFVPPPPYPVYSGGPFSALDVHEDNSFGGCLRNTFYSFFIGRDPNVPSARDIEAAYQSGLYNH